MNILDIKPTGKADKTEAQFSDSVAYNANVAYNADISYGGSDRKQEVFVGAVSMDSLKPITSKSDL